MTSDGLKLAGWFLPARLDGPGPAILVANGNAGNRAHRARLAEALREEEVSVLLFDYRDYGGNPGTPSEKGLHGDALAAHDYLASRSKVDARRMVYFGESIGAAVMVSLAAERQPAGMVFAIRGDADSGPARLFRASLRRSELAGYSTNL